MRAPRPHSPFWFECSLCPSFIRLVNCLPVCALKYFLYEEPRSPKSLSLTAWVVAHVSPAKLSHAAQMACAWLHVSVLNSFISVQLLILPVPARILVQMLISSHERCPFSDCHCSDRLAHFSVLNTDSPAPGLLQLICRKFGGFNNISRLLCCFALWQTLPALHQSLRKKKLCCFSSGSLSGWLHFVQCLAIPDER